MAYSKLHLEVADDIAVVTIDNPKVNALSREVLVELAGVFNELRHTTDSSVIIFTGAGKAFIAGADISELNQLDTLGAMTYARTGQHLTALMEMHPKPIIAAVNGFALGGGCELAMACTLRIASEKAIFAQPEVKLGVIAGFGGTQRLPRIVGVGRALELLLSGDQIDAAEAYRIGLVNKVVPAETLLDEAKAMAKKILAVGPTAVRFTKDAAYRGLSTSLEGGMRIEADLFGAIFATPEAKEGTAAFLEKRIANFKSK